jgi:hypothetical protein
MQALKPETGASGTPDRVVNPRAPKPIYQLPLELRLVIACSWIALPKEQAAQRELIETLCQGPVDWDVLLALLERHQMIVIATNRLLKCAGDSVPSTVKPVLKERSLAAWTWSVGLARELRSLIEVFRQAGVELMPFKGAVLASRLYGDPGMREVLDIDLLVRFDDLDRAHELLKSQKYRRTSPSNDVTPKQMGHLLRQCHHWVYVKQNPWVPIELHWRVRRWSDAETQNLWDRSQVRDWMGVPTRQPDEVLLLLSLCAHGSQHRYNRVKWLSDIVMLISGVDSWNWPEAIDAAKRLSLELPLAQAALLISWLYDFSVPAPLLDFAMAETSAHRFAEVALHSLMIEDLTPWSPKGELAGIRNAAYWLRQSAQCAWYATHLRKNQPLAARIGPILIGVTDFEAFPLPDRLFWLYYPLRPFFWIYRCLRGR